MYPLPPVGRKREFRFRPQPVAVFPWLFALVLVWYALPGSGFGPAQGSIIKAHYLTLMRWGKAVLAAYWFCAAAFFVARAIGQPRGTPGRLARIVLGIPVMGFAAGYGLFQLHADRPQDIGALGDVIVVVVGLCWPLTILLALYYARRKALCFALTSLAVSVFVAFPLTYVDMNAIWPFWRDMAQLRMADGRVYHVQNLRIMQGTENALTEEISRGPLFLRTRVIGVVPGESGLRLTRPEGVMRHTQPDAHGRLVLSPDSRWLLYVRRWSYEEAETVHVDLAYDLRHARLYGPGNLSSKLSPRTEALNWDEVVRLLDAEAGGAGDDGANGRSAPGSESPP